ncbi:TIGR03557 family F420-dependent LLM class oxidoreductase [Euzebya tangerina]|uniref:TIGR03557 family F420-dependent LLM class oxidoreductase n=1 Tax=Euzebya tangerina TaxID=591198 RepID=UPI000E31FF54|nr:TIGR03557 family F420-dependent LLM class oxidoreductase [Euzebya tangerina]
MTSTPATGSPRFGLKLMSELYGPRALVRQAQMAEEAGLDFVCISDHIHPWLPEHDHSPFAWSVLGGVAAATSIEMATGLTCPIGRYHPVIIAQAAATVAAMSDHPFTLALGAGERLNEHVTGKPFPSVAVRHEMLREACEIISLLGEGGFQSYRGEHFTADDVRIYDLPETPMRIVLGVSGDQSLDLAAAVEADGIMATDADPDLIAGWGERGGDAAQTWSEVPMAYADTAEEGLRLAHEKMRFALSGWKVMSELPNPVNFAAATELAEPADMADVVPHGPDPQSYAEAITGFVDAGFRNLSLIPIGNDVEATIRFFTEEVRPHL